MALCTVCSMDPCPHLKSSGGSAGAPAAAAKYAPSSKPHCPTCDRVHRNIGSDNQPVCAWRTYSRAKGEEFLAMTPASVDEFARWFRAGGWTAPIRKSRKAISASAPSSLPTTPVRTVTTPATSATVPSFAELDNDTVNLDADITTRSSASERETVTDIDVREVEAALAAL